MSVLHLSRTRRIDWPRVIENLRRTELSMQQIADQVGVSKASLHGYLDDRDIEPAHWVGSKLIELWCLKTGASWTDLPVRAVPLSVSAVMRSM